MNKSYRAFVPLSDGSSYEGTVELGEGKMTDFHEKPLHDITIVIPNLAKWRAVEIMELLSKEYRNENPKVRIS